MFAQLKKTRLTDGSYVWSLVICDQDDDRQQTELECYSEQHAHQLADSIRQTTSIPVLTTVQGE